MQVFYNRRVHDVLVPPSFWLVKPLLVLGKQVVEISLENITFKIGSCLCIIQKKMQIIKVANLSGQF